MRRSCRPWSRWVQLLALTAATGLIACNIPSPLHPTLSGSVGLPHDGVLTDSVKLPQKGDGFVRYRTDGVRYGSARLVSVLQYAAERVERERPGGKPLVIADLSKRFGGKATRHRSHRTGRDADLLLYALTTDGRSVKSPGFIRFGADGLAPTKLGEKRTYLRLDVERNWLLVKSLIEAPNAHVQWLFVARWLEALLIEYAHARGEDPELIWHAEVVLKQPSDSAFHHDHFHLRLACTLEEAAAGCRGGPQWPWLPNLDPADAHSDEELLTALLQ